MMSAENFAKRVVEDIITHFSVNALSIGADLDLFKHIAETGENGISPKELAIASECNERVIKEWLECCATNNYVNLTDNGNFYLPPGNAEVLLEKESPFYQRPNLKFIPSFNRVYPKVVEAFKTGRGVPYEDYGEECVEAIRDADAIIYKHYFSSEMLPKLGLKETFENEGAVVCDVGCGAGLLGIIIAREFPKVKVVGIDCDERSMTQAREYLAKESESVRSRITLVEDFLENLEPQHFDLMTYFQSLHDIPDPHKILETSKKFLKPNTGMIALLESNVTDDFRDMCLKPGERVPNLDENEVNAFARLSYGFSALHCLQCTMSQPHEYAAGTSITMKQIKEMCEAIGFEHVENVLSIDVYNLYKVY